MDEPVASVMCHLWHVTRAVVYIFSIKTRVLSSCEFFDPLRDIWRLGRTTQQSGDGWPAQSKMDRKTSNGLAKGPFARPLSVFLSIINGDLVLGRCLLSPRFLADALGADWRTAVTHVTSRHQPYAVSPHCVLPFPRSEFVSRDPLDTLLLIMDADCWCCIVRWSDADQRDADEWGASCRDSVTGRPYRLAHSHLHEGRPQTNRQ